MDDLMDVLRTVYGALAKETSLWMDLAKMHRNIFNGLKAEGFTDEQAMELLKEISRTIKPSAS